MFHKGNDLSIPMSMDKWSITFPLYRKGTGLGKINKKEGRRNPGMKGTLQMTYAFYKSTPKKMCL